MASASVTVANMPDILRALYDLRKVMEGAGGELGKVYSRGANQGRGPYEHWVQSAERQTWFHRRTGWHTDMTAVDEFEKQAQSMLESAFKTLSATNARDLLRGFTKDLLAEILDYMQDYPPAPSGSQYVRTYTLHDSWTSEIKV